MKQSRGLAGRQCSAASKIHARPARPARFRVLGYREPGPESNTLFPLGIAARTTMGQCTLHTWL